MNKETGEKHITVRPSVFEKLEAICENEKRNKRMVVTRLINNEHKKMKKDT